MEYKKTSTAKEKQANYARLKKLVSDLAYGGNNTNGQFSPDKQVQDYIKWVGLTFDQKKECYRQWDIYYQKCGELKSFAIFKEIREALKIGDMGKVRELVKQSAQIDLDNPELPKPNLLDPYDFLNSSSVGKYKSALWQIRSLEEESRKIESNELSKLF